MHGNLINKMGVVLTIDNFYNCFQDNKIKIIIFKM